MKKLYLLQAMYMWKWSWVASTHDLFGTHLWWIQTLHSNLLLWLVIRLNLTRNRVILPVGLECPKLKPLTLQGFLSISMSMHMVFFTLSLKSMLGGGWCWALAKWEKKYLGYKNPGFCLLTYLLYICIFFNSYFAWKDIQVPTQGAFTLSVVHKQKEMTHLITVHPYQEKKWCIAPVYNFIIPMLNKWTLHSKLASISNNNAKTANLPIAPSGKISQSNYTTIPHKDNNLASINQMLESSKLHKRSYSSS